MTDNFKIFNTENAPAGHKHQTEINALLTQLRTKECASEIGLLTYGGSIAYGLDTPTSDVDLRGFFLPTKYDLLMMEDVDTIVINEGVDGSLYTAKKMVNLLLQGNPNTVEILGVKPEHVIMGSSSYKKMLEAKDIFLSARMADTFGGYATQQLRRIENSMSRDNGDTDTKGALRSMNSAILSFEKKYVSFTDGDIAVRLDDEFEGSSALKVSMNLEDFPVKELRGMCGDLDAIAKNADNLAARNRKKDTSKLSKHMSHLVRLLRMGTEIMTTGEVNTFRENDAEFLKDLKSGLWMTEDDNGVRHVDDAFWDLLTEEQKAFEYAENNTVLPAKPDYDKAYELLREMHCHVMYD